MDSSFISFVIHIVVMIIAGIFGGIINFFLEQEIEGEKDRNKKTALLKSIIIGIGAAVLVPLFLTTISSEIIKLDKIDFSSILVFMGFCLIAAISSRKFISTLSANVLKTAREAKEEVKEVKEEISMSNKALYIVEDLLEDNPASNEKLPQNSDIKEAIQSASNMVRATIFRRAREYRRKNLKDDPEFSPRVIPIFEALIKSDKENRYHRNYAQLAYILLIGKSESKKAKAKDLLSKAIDIRDKKGSTSYQIYEYNRAICNIELDPDFKQSKSSASEKRENIISDLKKAVQIKRWKTVLSEAFSKNGSSLSDWLKLNKVKKKDIL